MGAALAVAVGLGVYPNMDAVDDLIKVKRVGRAAGGQTRRSTSACTRRFAGFYAALAPIYRSSAQDA